MNPPQARKFSVFTMRFYQYTMHFPLWWLISKQNNSSICFEAQSIYFNFNQVTSSWSIGKEHSRHKYETYCLNKKHNLVVNMFWYHYVENLAFNFTHPCLSNLEDYKNLEEKRQKTPTNVASPKKSLLLKMIFELEISGRKIKS